LSQKCGVFWAKKMKSGNGDAKMRLARSSLFFMHGRMVAKGRQAQSFHLVMCFGTENACARSGTGMRSAVERNFWCNKMLMHGSNAYADFTM
jgi:hypothetical protein